MTEEQAGKVQQAAQMMRGAVLNEVIFIERLVDEYITRHFCDEEHKKKELFELVICEFVVFEVKKNVLKYIMKTYDKKLYDQYNTCLEDMTTLMIFRNKLAHWLIDTSEESIQNLQQGKLRFIRFKNKTEYFECTNEYVKDINDKIVRCREMMYKLLEKTNPEPSE